MEADKVGKKFEMHIAKKLRHQKQETSQRRDWTVR